MKTDPLELTASSPSTSSRSQSHRGTVPTPGELESPPPYSPGPTARMPSRHSLSSRSSTSSRREDAPLRRPSTSSWTDGHAHTHEAAYGHELTAPRPAGCTQPPRLRKTKNWEGEPGCCCSTTGGCCFSSEGGCCFSSTEGCCFSSEAGCCFSSTEGCFFSSNKGCCFSNDEGSCCCGSSEGPKKGKKVRKSARRAHGVTEEAIGMARGVVGSIRGSVKGDDERR